MNTTTKELFTLRDNVLRKKEILLKAKYPNNRREQSPGRGPRGENMVEKRQSSDQFGSVNHDGTGCLGAKFIHS